MPHYGDDLYAWSQEQRTLLEAGQWGHVDMPHLLEELYNISMSEYSELSDRILGVLLAHLLKLHLGQEHKPHDFARAGQRLVVDVPGAAGPDCQKAAAQCQPGHAPEHDVSGGIRRGAAGLCQGLAHRRETLIPQTCPSGMWAMCTRQTGAPNWPIRERRWAIAQPSNHKVKKRACDPSLVSTVTRPPVQHSSGKE